MKHGGGRREAGRPSNPRDVSMKAAASVGFVVPFADLQMCSKQEPQQEGGQKGHVPPSVKANPTPLPSTPRHGISAQLH
ncbi:hypothetical protein GN956_G5905 [Arapaima gigas]